MAGRTVLTRATSVAVALSGVLAGCAGTRPPAGEPAGASSGPSSSSARAESPGGATSQDAGSPATSPRRGVTVTTGSSEFGTMLFDGRGQAIYLFDREGGPRPRCYGVCAEAWPPVLARGTPRVRGVARPDLVETVRRRDGTRQVTYAGHPLYFYAHEGPGQVLCHDVAEYGGTWLVVTPAGRAAAS